MLRLRKFVIIALAMPDVALERLMDAFSPVTSRLLRLTSRMSNKSINLDKSWGTGCWK